MKVLVYGAGVIGSLLAARLHEAGHDISPLARGERLAALRENGVLVAEAGSPTIRQVPVPVGCSARVDHRGRRRRPVYAELGGRAGAARCGHRPKARVAGAFPRSRVDGRGGGPLQGDLPAGPMVSMPIGEPSGIVTPRLEHIVQIFGSGGINATAEPQIDAWLKTHAAFEVPLEQAVHAPGALRLWQVTPTPSATRSG